MTLMAIASCSVFWLLPNSATAQGRTEVIAETGMVVTDEQIALGQFDPFFGLGLTDSGKVVFSAASSPSQMFEFDQGTFTKMLDNNTSLDQAYDYFQICGVGDEVTPVWAHLNNNEGSVFNFNSLTKTLEPVLTAGDPAPDGNGTIGRILHGVGHPAYVQSGGKNAWAVQVTYNNTTGGASDNAAIWVWDGQQAIEVIREGKLLPGGVTCIRTVFYGHEIRVNEQGHVLFFNATQSDLEVQ